MYANVKRLLQSAERTNCVRLSSLALRPLHFRPVVRALQFQTSLKQLELPGNLSFIQLSLRIDISYSREESVHVVILLLLLPVATMILNTFIVILQLRGWIATIQKCNKNEYKINTVHIYR